METAVHTRKKPHTQITKSKKARERIEVSLGGVVVVITAESRNGSSRRGTSHRVPHRWGLERAAPEEQWNQTAGSPPVLFHSPFVSFFSFFKKKNKKRATWLSFWLLLTLYICGSDLFSFAYTPFRYWPVFNFFLFTWLILTLVLKFKTSSYHLTPGKIVFDCWKMIKFWGLNSICFDCYVGIGMICRVVDE